MRDKKKQQWVDDWEQVRQNKLHKQRRKNVEAQTKKSSRFSYEFDADDELMETQNNE